MKSVLLARVARVELTGQLAAALRLRGPTAQTCMHIRAAPATRPLAFLSFLAGGPGARRQVAMVIPRDLLHIFNRTRLHKAARGLLAPEEATDLAWPAEGFLPPRSYRPHRRSATSMVNRGFFFLRLADEHGPQGVLGLVIAG